MSSSLDSRTLRRILGHYPTGVCAITTMIETGPVGMIVGSFTSVSLDPPLVAFLPDRRSARWSAIQAAGHFCVNVLSERQQPVCRALSSKAKDEFETLSFRLSATGLPILDGIVAWIDCRLSAVHEAGDHDIVVGEVRSLSLEAPQSPLLFFQGGYGGFSPACAEPALHAILTDGKTARRARNNAGP